MKILGLVPCASAHRASSSSGGLGRGVSVPLGALSTARLPSSVVGRVKRPPASSAWRFSFSPHLHKKLEEQKSG